MGWLKNALFFWKKPAQRFKSTVEWGFYCAVAHVGTHEYRIIAAPGIGKYDLLLSLREITKNTELSIYAIGITQPMSSNANSRLFDVTHRFTVSRIFAGGHIALIGIWDIFLNADIVTQEQIDKVLRNTAHRMLLVSHYTRRTEDMTWQGQVDRINWAGLLQQQIEIEFWKDFDIKARQIYPQD